MRWIRLWIDESINGTTFTELNAEHRGVWFTLLLLAGYSPKPGTICISEGIAYTREQLAAFTKLTLTAINSGIEHLSSDNVNKIIINPDDTISISNWLNYQTEYDRQKGYRRGLQGKVTHKGDEQKSSVSISVSTGFNIKGLSQNTWDDFKEHRAAIKAKLSPNAEKRLLKRLARMVEEGGNAEEIVGRSIENGWKGLFPGGNNATRQHIDNSVPARIQRAHDAKRANRGAHGKVVDADG